MSKLILIRGLPGSGKSTMARDMVRKADHIAFHFETDMYFVRPDGYYDFNPKLLNQAHMWCQDKVSGRMSWCDKGDEVIVVSNTFSQVWEMVPYLKMAEDFGWEVEIITATGNYKNVHGVPDHVIQRMRDRWEEFEYAK